jgi:quinol monooxygenase YgiN
MKYCMLRFRVRVKDAAAAEKAIITFVAKVADEPGTLRYESFREGDGSYVHVMGFADAPAEEAHMQTEHAKQFAAVLRPLCESPPEYVDLAMVSGAGR